MKRYRSTIIKFIYPPVFVICVIHGYRVYQAIFADYQRLSTEGLTATQDSTSTNFIYLLTFQILCILFFIFLIISFILLLKPPTMKKYEISLKTVLEYENRNEDVLENQGQEMRKETDYRLSAKRFHCPTCNTPTEGITGTIKMCENCGNTFKLS